VLLPAKRFALDDKNGYTLFSHHSWRKEFFYFSMNRSASSHKPYKERGKGNMNANGIIRGYMACHMKVDSFASHVANCVRRQLLEFESTATFHMDYHTNFFLFYGQAFGQTFQLLLTFAEVEVLKAKGPYALDRRIWEEMKAKGLPIKNTTHYLQTVLADK
jgi:hypothetical protein